MRHVRFTCALYAHVLSMPMSMCMRISVCLCVCVCVCVWDHCSCLYGAGTRLVQAGHASVLVLLCI